MRARILLRPSLILAVFFALAAGVSRANPGGAYIWGGMLSSYPGLQGFTDTVQLALEKGFSTIRFTIGSNVVGDYGLSPDPCVNSQSLACYARFMFASPVWDSLNLRRVMITAHDFAAFKAGGRSNEGYLRAPTLSANVVAIEAEYTALFEVLKSRFGGRKIQFVISNWEGDNLIYCGSSFQFSDDSAFASSCQSRFLAAQTNAQRVQAFLQWIGYKDAAIWAFVAANPGFNLISAPEFSSLHMFVHNCGGYCNAVTDTVLDQIAIAGGRAYCSYSSYDSENGLAVSYLNDIKDILKICGHLIIGEAGYDLDTTAPIKIEALYQTLAEAATLPGLVAVTPWHFVDAPGARTVYGIFTATGSPLIYNLMGPLRPARP